MPNNFAHSSGLTKNYGFKRMLILSSFRWEFHKGVHLVKSKERVVLCLVAISIVATTLTLYGCLGKLSQRHAQLISCLSRIFQREGHFVKGFFTRWTWSIKALGNTLYKCLSSAQNISIFLCTLYYQKNVPVRLLSFRNFSRG